MYVDDIIVICKDVVEREFLQKELSKEFKIKEFGKFKFFLGIEVAYSRKEIVVFKRKYVLNFPKETRYLNSKAASTHIDANHMIGQIEEVQLIKEDTED